MPKDTTLDSFDLIAVRKRIAESDGTEKPIMSVDFVKEDVGKWRMSDGLGERSVTFEISAEAGSSLNMGWGYWDPNYLKDDGTTGKWVQYSVNGVTPDENGIALIDAELPVAATRLALEVWDYSDNNGDLDADGVELLRVLTK